MSRINLDFLGKDYKPTNYGERVLHSLIAGVVPAAIAACFFDFKIALSVFGIVFGAWSNYAAYKTTKSIEDELLLKKITIHALYSSKIVKRLNGLISSRNYNGIHFDLGDLEESLTAIWGCCANGASQRVDFHLYKGVIGGLKEAVIRSRTDASINIDYNGLITTLHDINTKLLELNYT